MTDDQKYAEIMKELGELLMQKNNHIQMKDFQVERLQTKLSAAEKELQELRKD